MPHKAHGEEEVDDREDSVQPEEVIAKEDTPVITAGHPNRRDRVQGWG